MKPTTLLLGATCLALLPSAHADYQAEASLRYGPLQSQFGTKNIPAPNLELLKFLTPERTDAIGLSFTHYAWSNHEELAVLFAPWLTADFLPLLTGTRVHIRSRRDALMGSYRHRWSLREGLSVSGSLRIGANQGHTTLTFADSGTVSVTQVSSSTGANTRLTPVGGTIISSGVIFSPVPTSIHTSLCAETEWGLSQEFSEHWTASVSLVASCLEGRADSGSARLQGIQAKAGLGCRF